MARKTLIAPSILSANFAEVGKAVQLIEESHGDWVHLDVMDGRFVPNLTFGPKLVADIRPLTRLPLDTHLMIVEPERLVREFAAAGSDFITFHMEAVVHADRLVSQIEDLGKEPGISIVPSTPISAIGELLPRLFQVLVMTVNPGFGGQKMIRSCLRKVEKLDGLRREQGLSFKIAVDGGVNLGTAPELRGAGADVLIAGSAFFGSDDPSAAVAAFRGKADG